MNDTITPKIEALLNKAESKNSFITEIARRHLRSAVAELKIGKPDFSYVDTQLEAAYTVIYKDREVVFENASTDPKESDPAFVELSEALETVNDCIEQVTNEY